MPIIYTKKFMKTVSIIAILSTVLLLFRNGMRIVDIIVNYPEYEVLTKREFFRYINIIIQNFIFIGIFIFLIFNPQKFILIGLIALFYSVDILLSNTQFPYMGIPMFALSIATFAIRGFFLKNKKIKISIFAATYIICLVVPVFYVDHFLDYLIIKIAISFVIFIAIFFFIEYAKQIASRQATKEKILNIASFKGLERSDMYLLQQILDNKKYKEIAQNIHGSEGALRNKLSKIYKILEVGDRTGFLTIYSGYELIYEPEQSKNLTN